MITESQIRGLHVGSGAPKICPDLRSRCTHKSKVHTMPQHAVKTIVRQIKTCTNKLYPRRLICAIIWGKQVHRDTGEMYIFFKWFPSLMCRAAILVRTVAMMSWFFHATDGHIFFMHLCCMVRSFSRVWTNRIWFLIQSMFSLRGKIRFLLSPFVPKNLILRDGFGRPVPSQPAHSTLPH